ncbi:uncharacterized protein BJ171DRAFT_509189 [Polychytrium aggregatum]|uniref:uncharacterized protein n=1 Tax=Polychytrium aggregatum TaxID=110093 RepID=UPI0022FE6FC8|nr:uncharacterized protein BJ171DRAFT_509189 [Polychytrium aggregatum]KAI9203651.1 hypothetical protein BJ171DRAFT_509189 [Polychytrium aggregatum]
MQRPLDMGSEASASPTVPPTEESLRKMLDRESHYNEAYRSCPCLYKSESITIPRDTITGIAIVAEGPIDGLIWSRVDHYSIDARNISIRYNVFSSSTVSSSCMQVLPNTERDRGVPERYSLKIKPSRELMSKEKYKNIKFFVVVEVIFPPLLPHSKQLGLKLQSESLDIVVDNAVELLELELSSKSSYIFVKNTLADHINIFSEYGAIHIENSNASLSILNPNGPVTLKNSFLAALQIQSDRKVSLSNVQSRSLFLSGCCELDIFDCEIIDKCELVSSGNSKITINGMMTHDFFTNISNGQFNIASIQALGRVALIGSGGSLDAVKVTVPHLEIKYQGEATGQLASVTGQHLQIEWDGAIRISESSIISLSTSMDSGRIELEEVSIDDIVALHLKNQARCVLTGVRTETAELNLTEGVLDLKSCKVKSKLEITNLMGTTNIEGFTGSLLGLYGGLQVTIKDSTVETVYTTSNHSVKSLAVSGLSAKILELFSEGDITLEALNGKGSGSLQVTTTHGNIHGHALGYRTTRLRSADGSINFEFLKPSGEDSIVAQSTKANVDIVMSDQFVGIFSVKTEYGQVKVDTNCFSDNDAFYELGVILDEERSKVGDIKRPGFPEGTMELVSLNGNVTLTFKPETPADGIVA